MNKKITFVRVLRDCTRNHEIKRRRESRGLIYDFDVLADGVKIAQFRGNVYKRGYELCDLDGAPVKAPLFGADGVRRVDDPVHCWRSCGVDKKADFEAEILNEFDYIPTAEQIEQRRAAEKDEEERVKANRLEEIRIARIKNAGPEMLQVLIKAVEDCEAEISACGVVCVDVDAMKAVIAKATGGEA